jgi:hypothetical protein
MIEDQALSPSYDLAEKERQLFDGKGGRGGGDKSYDSEEAWSSIIHSILSVSTRV